MNRLLLLGFLIYGLILAGLAGLKGELLALAIPGLIYLGAALLDRPAALRLKASRSLSAGRALPGEPVEVKLTITNEGPELVEVFLEDLIPKGLELVAGQPRRLVALPPGLSFELTYELKGERGAYHFGGAQVTTGDQPGLFLKRHLLPAPARLLILPEVIRLRQLEIRPRQTRVYSGLIRARRGGPGVEFFGVREYRPGDPLRWINSRASARRPEALFINEFEQERIADVGLILDARRQSDARSPEGSLFEYSIQATAALADVFLNAGNRVGLFIYGRFMDWTLPGYGKMQRERIWRALARAEQGEGHVFEKLVHLPTRLFPARSQLVLISPLLPHDPEMLILLRAQGYRLLVISPDPLTFERRGPAETDEGRLAGRIAYLERALLLAKLRQAGIRVLDWPVEMPFQQAVQAALGRFQDL